MVNQQAWAQTEILTGPWGQVLKPNDGVKWMGGIEAGRDGREKGPVRSAAPVSLSSRFPHPTSHLSDVASRWREIAMDVSIQEKRQSEQIVTLIVSGEVDAYTAPQLRERLMPLCQKMREVHLNLSQVDYMDSTALGVLIGAYKQLRSRKGRLVLTGMSPRLKRLFRITGLTEVIDIEEDGA
ncbi:anti-anti-sigma factor (RsbW antagonist) [Desmospora sp. 8437]|nr:anti-anti-sigma factor (RsbW antagonist) [Desmospora sp. 8437]